MQTLLSYIKTLAPLLTPVAAALTPVYGKYAWYVAVVAIAVGIGLISPSVLPARTTTGGGTALPQQAKTADPTQQTGQ